MLNLSALDLARLQFASAISSKVFKTTRLSAY